MAANIEIESSLLACLTAPVPSTELTFGNAAGTHTTTSVIEPIFPAKGKANAGFDVETSSSTDAQSTVGGDADEVDSRSSNLGSVDSDSEYEDVDVKAWASLGTRCRDVIANFEDGERSYFDLEPEAEDAVPDDAEKWRSASFGMAQCLRAVANKNEDKEPTPIDVEKWCNVGLGVILCLRAAVAGALDDEPELSSAEGQAWRSVGNSCATAVASMADDELELSSAETEAWQSVGTRCATTIMSVADEEPELSSAEVQAWRSVGSGCATAFASMADE